MINVNTQIYIYMFQDVYLYIYTNIPKEKY